MRISDWSSDVCSSDLGSAELAPGLSIHRIGGHTHGLQCVRVHTRRGWIVLASDCSHYYEHFEKKRAFTTVFHVGDLIDGYSKLDMLADSPKHIVPGHDPLVMQRRSEEHTSELQSLMRISYAVFCLKKNTKH